MPKARTVIQALHHLFLTFTGYRGRADFGQKCTLILNYASLIRDVANIQVFHIFRINESFLFQCKYNKVTDFKSVIPIKTWAKLSFYCIIFPAASLCSSAEMSFPFIFPDNKFVVLPNCDRKLNFAWILLLFFWVLKYVLNYWNRGSIGPLSVAFSGEQKVRVFSVKYKTPNRFLQRLIAGGGRKIVSGVLLELLILHKPSSL